jgi:integrase
LRFAVKRVCKAAGLVDADGKPLVTPHGLRGTFASLGEREHVASDVVAGAIGHAGMSAYGSYAKAEAVHVAAQERALKVISGGKR